MKLLIQDIIPEELDSFDSDVDPSEDGDPVPQVVIDNSYFAAELTAEEQNILAIIMKQGWVQRQLTSIENTRMKYSGADFKMTSQANHMAKLKELLDESRRDSLHNQRLYKRRKKKKDGSYSSNWSILRKSNANKEI